MNRAARIGKCLLPCLVGTARRAVRGAFLPKRSPRRGDPTWRASSSGQRVHARLVGTARRAVREFVLVTLLAGAALLACGAEIKFDFTQVHDGRIPPGFTSRFPGRASR